MHDPASYERNVLFQSEMFEVVSCLWRKGDVSPMHGHGWSQCYALVQEGLFENKTNSGLKEEVSVVEAGQTLFTLVGVDHEMTCLSPNGKTLHVYVPKVKKQADANRFKTPLAQELKEQISLALGKEGVKWEDLNKAIKSVEQNSLTTNSPYFMNQLFSGVQPEILLAEEVISRTRTTMATYEAAPVFTLIEMEIVQNLAKLVGWENGEGLSVPGGSAANFMALHCARQKRFPQAKTKGLGNQAVKIFASEESHYSFKKAAMALGFGTDSIVLVESDELGRMKPEDLQAKMALAVGQNQFPLLVAATAGTTVLGAFDPIDKLAQVCSQYKTWLHVDGAWGGPAIFSDRAKVLLKGIEKADSMTFDAHKLFGANLTCSFFLAKDPEILLAANDVSGGEYLFHDNSEVIDRGRLSWQCGRSPDAMSFWTLWKSHGQSGLGQFVDRLLDVKDQTVSWIKNQSRLELIAQPDFLNICVRVKSPSPEISDGAWTLKVRNALRENNIAMVNYSVDKSQQPFLRLILAHPKLDTTTVQNILEAALEIR